MWKKLKKAARKNNIALAIVCGAYAAGAILTVAGLYVIYCGFWLMQPAAAI